MEPIPEISIVIPLYNEETNVLELYNQLIKVLDILKKSYEIIFADDGSNDGSLEIIESIASNDENIKCISLSRNFGHQIALFAGIEKSKGNVVITMDADLQHPPELIEKLYKTYEQAYDIVNTKRIETEKEPLLKKATSKGFYRLINSLSKVNIEGSSSDFRLMSRKATDAFLKFQEKDRFTRGLISWMGFNQTFLEYKAPQRFSGKSKYTIRKMMHFAFDGITSFSSKPLRFSFYIGLITFSLGLLYAIYAIFQFIFGNTVAGWPSILCSVLIIGGVQLLSLGIIGEYIARIFNESKNRPPYLVKREINC